MVENSTVTSNKRTGYYGVFFWRFVAAFCAWVIFKQEYKCQFIIFYEPTLPWSKKTINNVLSYFYHYDICSP